MTKGKEEKQPFMIRKTLMNKFEEVNLPIKEHFSLISWKTLLVSFSPNKLRFLAMILSWLN